MSTIDERLDKIDKTLEQIAAALNAQGRGIKGDIAEAMDELAQKSASISEHLREADEIDGVTPATALADIANGYASLVMDTCIAFGIDVDLGEIKQR